MCISSVELEESTEEAICRPWLVRRTAAWSEPYQDPPPSWSPWTPPAGEPHELCWRVPERFLRVRVAVGTSVHFPPSPQPSAASTEIVFSLLPAGSICSAPASHFALSLRSSLRFLSPLCVILLATPRYKRTLPATVAHQEGPPSGAWLSIRAVAAQRTFISRPP